jgi:hypothetical protein
MWLCGTSACATTTELPTSTIGPAQSAYCADVRAIGPPHVSAVGSARGPNGTQTKRRSILGRPAGRQRDLGRQRTLIGARHGHR